MTPNMILLLVLTGREPELQSFLLKRFWFVPSLVLVLVAVGLVVLGGEASLRQWVALFVAACLCAGVAAGLWVRLGARWRRSD